MEKEIFVTYEIALKLKLKGFNERCLAKYMIDIKGEIIPHFRYNYVNSEGMWFNHNGKDTTGLNGN